LFGSSLMDITVHWFFYVKISQAVLKQDRNQLKIFKKIQDFIRLKTSFIYFQNLGCADDRFWLDLKVARAGKEQVKCPEALLLSLIRWIGRGQKRRVRVTPALRWDGRTGGSESGAGIARPTRKARKLRHLLAALLSCLRYNPNYEFSLSVIKNFTPPS